MGSCAAAVSHGVTTPFLCTRRRAPCFAHRSCAFSRRDRCGLQFAAGRAMLSDCALAGASCWRRRRPSVAGWCVAVRAGWPSCIVLYRGVSCAMPWWSPPGAVARLVIIHSAIYWMLGEALRARPPCGSLSLRPSTAFPDRHIRAASSPPLATPAPQGAAAQPLGRTAHPATATSTARDALRATLRAERPEVREGCFQRPRQR